MIICKRIIMAAAAMAALSAVPAMGQQPARTQATDTAADCIPGTRHYGNMRRDSLRGPDYRQWDLAIYKNTHITERLNLQLRADFFNVTNHANYGAYNGQINSTTFGQPRQNLLNAYQPRVMQLAFKLSF